MGCMRPRSITGYPEMNTVECVSTSAGSFEFVLRRSARARSVSVTVSAGGRVAVVAPERTAFSVIQSFLEQRAGWLARSVSYFARLPAPMPLARASESERATLQIQLAERVGEAAQRLGVSAPLFVVKTMRSRFGSCSYRGHLAFSDTLRALPPELFDYVVAHEVCHLREMNHSPAFWQLVERLIPDWRARRSALKKYHFV